MSEKRLCGVLAPALTPFRRDLSVDTERYLQHANWLLANGCSGLAVFGTNSEANSLSLEERMSSLEFLIDNGIPPAKLMPGTGCCAFPDSVKLTSHAVKLGCAGVLMLPPFYYKNVPDEGLVRSFSEVIERVGDSRLRVYLYHIPPIAQVPIPIPVIEKLVKRYPGTVAGIKDSSGDWNNTQALLDVFKGAAFDVFAGSETFLLPTMRGGGAGCISANANVNCFAINRVFENWRSDEAEEWQRQISLTRTTIQKSQVMIPALKAILAHYREDPEFANVRPPLVEMSVEKTRALVADLDALGYVLTGFEKAHVS